MTLAQQLRQFLPTVYQTYGSLNARQYAYRAETAGLVVKVQFKYVNAVLTELREEGVLPWSAVLDSSRDFSPYQVSGSEDTEEYMRYYMEDFKKRSEEFGLPKWQYQKIVPVIFTEKEGLIPYFEMVTGSKGVSIYAQRGQVGKSHLHEVVFPWLMKWAGSGKKIRMIYLGDCDDEGYQIPLTLLSTITKWATRGPELDQKDIYPRVESRKCNKGSVLTFERLALTPGQASQLGLRKDPINLKSKIAHKFVDFKCELEAMDPNHLRALISDAIDQSWDAQAEIRRQAKVQEMRKTITERVEELTYDWPS